MEAEHQSLTLRLLQGQGDINQGLLMAARRHVGAAGIEQTAALERLIAAGQAHSSLTQALQRVVTLLQKGEDTQALSNLLEESQLQLLLLDMLAAAVTEALEQITATPVVQVSAQVLDGIAQDMQQRLNALQRLVEEIRLSPAVPDGTDVGLEATRLTLETELLRIRQAEHRGKFAALVDLAQQTIGKIARQDHLSSTERQEALEALEGEVRAAQLTLTASA